ncbi:MAG: Abi family protein [Clostridia bacterium]|nr:Abi family protein [Clostridia bacterium]
MEKEFKTIDEQIELLQSRNLHIENEETAKEVLLNNNYYYLINGYKDLFLNRKSKTEKFRNRTTLEEIYSLYEFDRKIRIIFLEYILLIERKIDTYIGYEFSKNYGHKDYLIPENFNNISKNKELIDKFLNDINFEIAHQYKNSNKMIRHYLDVYKYIPLWVLIRILSFGKVSKFYSFMKQKEQNNVSRKFNIKSETLKVYLINLGNVRNICAHDEKLYDVILKNRINTTNYHKKLDLIKIDDKTAYATRDLFSIVIILKALLEKEQFNEFYNRIIETIKELENKLLSLKIDKVLYKMGFPKNHKELINL